MNRKTLLTSLVIAACGVTAAVVYGTGSRSEGLEYSLGVVDRGSIESVVITTGTLEALNTVVVGSQLSGQIAELHADFNDAVEFQQLIARLDPRTFMARVEQNRADVKVAKASILQSKAEVRRSRATLAQAQRELARREGLKENGHISASELDQDMTNVETAEAQLAMSDASVINAEAVLEQRVAALHQSELDLERTDIRSPVAGTVINRTVEVGQTVAASLQAPELFQIAQDLHQMKVEASVDEADIGRISEGLMCRFTVDAYPDRQFQGRVQQIRKAPDVEQNVVTYRVIITAANDDLALLPGMTANVEMVLGSKRDVLKLPNAALRFAPKGAGAPPAGTAARGEGRGPGAFFERLRAELNLTAAQEASLDRLAAAQREHFGNAATSGDREAQRARFQQTRDNMVAKVRAILDPGQQQQLDALMASAGRSGVRRTTVWMLEDDVPIPRSIQVGLSDEQATEVVRGLDEGDTVIVRAVRTKDG